LAGSGYLKEQISMMEKEEEKELYGGECEEQKEGQKIENNWQLHDEY